MKQVREAAARRVRNAGEEQSEHQERAEPVTVVPYARYFQELDDASPDDDTYAFRRAGREQKQKLTAPPRRYRALCKPEEDNSGIRSTRLPGLRRAINRARRNQAAVLVTSLDRVARTTSELSDLIVASESEGWNLIALDDEILGGEVDFRRNPMMADWVKRLGGWEKRSMAAWDSENLKARRARGEQIGRPVSTSPELATRILVWAKQGTTPSAVAARLNQEGVPTPRGGSAWRPSTINAILRWAERDGVNTTPAQVAPPPGEPISPRRPRA